MKMFSGQQEKEACSLMCESTSFRAVIDETVGRELYKQCQDGAVSALKKRVKHFQAEGKMRKSEDAEALALAIALSGIAMSTVGKVIFQLDDDTLLKASKALGKVIAKGLEVKP